MSPDSGLVNRWRL